jgi:hypothetical protein
MSSLSQFDLRLNRGVSDFNIAQTFVITGTWRVPGLDSLPRPLAYAGVEQEGKIGSTRRELDCRMKTLPQPWMVAREAPICAGAISIGRPYRDNNRQPTIPTLAS